MSWYSVGAEEAEKVAASVVTRRSRNFFTKGEDESARIRFLKPAAESFNYKRAYVSWAKGQKLLTSPGTSPDPFVARGLSLQAAFAWPIIDRRTFEFDDEKTGEKRKVGPRMLYFADGTRTRKQLIAFEKEMLASENESRQEDGLDPLEPKDFNLTHYDIKASKPKGAPWNFVAMKPKELSASDKELIEKYAFEMHEELAPLPEAELAGLLRRPEGETETESESTTEYSYSADEEDVVKFD